jgi:hypothetical protein
LINVKGNANGNLSGDEQYPIHLGNAVEVQPTGTVYFPGVPGQDVIAFDVDDTGATLIGGVLGALASSTPSGAATVVGVRDGIHVAPNAAGLATGGIIGIVTIYGPTRDGIHVDSGRLSRVIGLFDNNWLVHSAGRAGMYCRSETLTSAASTVGYANFAFDGAGTYGVFAGHGCSLGVDPSSSGFQYSVNPSGCPSAGELQYGVWLEEDSVMTFDGAINCVNSDAVSLRVSAAYPTEAPAFSAPFGLQIDGAGCSGIYVESGLASAPLGSIMHAHWGITLHSSLTASGPSAPSTSFAGNGLSPGKTMSFSCNGSFNAGACCVAGDCPPGSDIFNNSGLPLDARFSTFTSAPAVCSCNASLASCTCTGSAAGSATPPDGVAVIDAPLTTGTPTTDVSGAFTVAGPACH